MLISILLCELIEMLRSRKLTEVLSSVTTHFNEPKLFQDDLKSNQDDSLSESGSHIPSISSIYRL